MVGLPRVQPEPSYCCSLVHLRSLVLGKLCTQFDSQADVRLSRLRCLPPRPAGSRRPYWAQVHVKLDPSASAEHVDVCGLVELPTLLISI